MTEEQGVSERHAIANQIADFISENGLTVPYGGDVHKGPSESSGRIIYSVSFAHPRSLDGCAEVWGKTFIRVTSNWPMLESIVFGNVEDALKFLELAFVEVDIEAALEVPHRMPTGV